MKLIDFLEKITSDNLVDDGNYNKFRKNMEIQEKPIPLTPITLTTPRTLVF